MHDGIDFDVYLFEDFHCHDVSSVNSLSFLDLENLYMCWVNKRHIITYYVTPCYTIPYLSVATLPNDLEQFKVVWPNFTMWACWREVAITLSNGVNHRHGQLITGQMGK